LIDATAIRATLEEGVSAFDHGLLQQAVKTSGNNALFALRAATRLKRAGVEMRFIMDEATAASSETNPRRPPASYPKRLRQLCAHHR
jgi:hypothetical protein